MASFMKYIILVPDGMADYPIKELGDKTPLEAARKPNMDFIAQNGILGRIQTVPALLSPASDVANLSILGYDPQIYYMGRAPFEAANIGVELEEGDLALRCNFISASEGKIIDYSAGHISSKEAAVLIYFLNKKLGSQDIKFYPGVSYRHLLVIKNCGDLQLKDLECTPPHDIMGLEIDKFLPKGKQSEILVKLMQDSRQILPEHDINQVRIDLGENPANMIWLWGAGKKINLPKFKDMFGVSGAVISGVDLIKGIGKTIGLEVINVPGATAYYDSDILAKAKYAMRALKNKDFVFVHVEAIDEAGHNGDLRQKIAMIERFDQLVVGTVLNSIKRLKNFKLAVLPDHATPISLRTHTRDTVFFGLYGKDVISGGFSEFTEKEAQKAQIHFEKGHEFMPYFISETTTYGTK